jgi:pyruvate/2-oxoacid:ferredoxin oxidoreductase beta subunit
MGFRKPNLDLAQFEIGKSLIEIASPYNDGWTSSSCKQELYQLKCWLDDEYNKLPTFTGEEKWEQERLIQVLKIK